MPHIYSILFYIFCQQRADFDRSIFETVFIFRIIYDIIAQRFVLSKELYSMKIAIVDIGSNTVKMKIFDTPSDRLIEIFSDVRNAKLISYIENGRLNENGINLLCGIISEFKEESTAHNADVFRCFATASLRRTENANDIRQAVLSACSVEIDIVSGSDEALYSFSGAKNCLIDFPDNCMMIDMGGGSTELVSCKNGSVTDSFSMNFGSLSLFLDMNTDFDRIRSYAYDTVERNAPQGSDKAVLVGGTALAIRELYRLYFKQTEESEMTVSNLKKLYGILKTNDEGVQSILKKTVPHRVTTVIPGLAAYLGIFEYCATKTVYVTTGGIREGYVYENILTGKDG